MCGINGIVKRSEVVERSEIKRMNTKTSHRGPDDEGIFVESQVGLGHNRLAIIDLSEKGKQPMKYEHMGQLVYLVFNGEIYNYQEIKSSLQEKGYEFTSLTDSEVILAAYLEYGVNCLQRFNGMFAFVIYDTNREILFGARDRFGQKPLKYYLDQERFVFSSELKAILTQDVPREIDFEAINHFLTLQYVPAPLTGFRGICKLPHAHYFVFNIEKWGMEIRQYFKLDFTCKLQLTKEEWLNLIERSLDQAVRKRLVSDVPLGAFLSGGVDSSAVVAFMSKHLPKVKTFSIGFKEGEFDESKYAQLVAKRYGTEHTEFIVSAEDLKEHFEDLVIHFEEPFADSSQLPTYLLSKLTRNQVTVALSGDAGDENFGGYDRHRLHAFTVRYFNLIKWLKCLSGPVYLGGQLFGNRELGKLSVYLATLQAEVNVRHYNYTSYFDEHSKYSLYKEEWRKRFEGTSNPFESLLREIGGLPPMEAVLYLDLNSYLPDDINVKVDMASMREALEVRTPMLDYEFVQLMAQMPWGLKTGMRGGKLIFKKMLRKYLPDEILFRKKRGFSLPIKYWFRGDLREKVREVVLDGGGLVRQLFEHDGIESLLESHDVTDQSRRIWALMSLNIWHHEYFRKK